MSRPQPPFEITPDLLLRAYAIGLFPMAEDRDSQHLHWVEPERRGVFPLDRLTITKSLAKAVRAERYVVTANQAFREVMQGCAKRERTWINREIPVFTKSYMQEKDGYYCKGCSNSLISVAAAITSAKVGPSARGFM